MIHLTRGGNLDGKAPRQRGGNIRKRSDGRWEGRYTTGYDPTTCKRIIKMSLAKPKPKSRLNWPMTASHPKSRSSNEKHSTQRT